MTKPLPAGTCNLSVHLLREEHQAISREAYGRGVSVCEFIRDAVLGALPEPEQGRLGKLRQERARFLRLKRIGDNARAWAARRARKRAT